MIVSCSKNKTPLVVAEIAFPLWLLIKGVNTAQWERRALASA
jgi:hypothetical protein